jgi:hypothetical protein
MGSRWTAPALVGVVALVAAGWLLWLTLKGDGGDHQAAPVATTTLVNKAGGYTVKVPKGMTAKRAGKATKIVDKGHVIDVTITPTRGGRPAAGNTRVLATMGSTYRTVDLLSTDKKKIDGRNAVISIGKAITKKGVRVRFVLITVKGGPSTNYAISTFTAADSDPNVVLPQVRAIANGFHVSRR